MDQMLIIVTAFVGAAALAAGGLLLWGGRASHQMLEQRLDLLASSRTPTGRKGVPGASLLAEPLTEQINPLEEFVSRFLNLKRLLDQAAVRFSPMQFLAATMISGTLAGAICFVTPMHKGFIPIAVMTGATLPLMALLLKRRQRMSSFGRQLPEALELISRALRAGHSLGAGMNLVADEMGAPIREEFSRCYEEQNLGVPLEQALEAMTERVPNLDLRFFATAVILQRQTGGDLAEILDKIGHLVRERFKIWGQIQALTGEGRLSGIVLLALPPVLFVVMYRMNPTYVMMLFTDPMGRQMLAGAVVMQLLGAVVIKKIVNIKV